MSFKRKKSGLAIFVIGIAAFGAILLQHSYAATGQIYFTPTTVSVQNGNSITLTARINPGVGVNQAVVKITYDKTKLEYQSPVDASGSDFPLELASPTGGSGTLDFTRVRLTEGDIATDAFIAKIKFKALTGSGNTTVSISGNATSVDGYTNPAGGNTVVTFTTPPVIPPKPVVSLSATNTSLTVGQSTTLNWSATNSPTSCTAGGDWSGSKAASGSTSTGALSSAKTYTYNLSCANAGGTGTATATVSVKAAGTTPSSPNPGSSPSPKPKPNPSPSPSTQNTTQTTSAGVIVEPNVQFTKATFTVTSPTPVKAHIEYGTDGQINISTPETALGTTHTIGLDSSLLLSGTVYQYKVVTVDAAGKRTDGEIATIKTKGFTVRVTVLDKNKKPVAKKDVTLFSDPIQAKTDSDGVAEFVDVAPGPHKLKYTNGNKTYEKDISVSNDVVDAADGQQTASIQNISVILEDYAVSNYMTIVILAAAGLILVVAIIMALKFLNKKRDMNKHFYSGPSQTSGGQGGGITFGTPNPTTTGGNTNDVLNQIQGVGNPHPGSTIGPASPPPVSGEIKRD